MPPRTVCARDLRPGDIIVGFGRVDNVEPDLNDDFSPAIRVDHDPEDDHAAGAGIYYDPDDLVHVHRE